MARSDSDETWARELEAYVAHHPIVILNLEERELHGLKETRDGMRQFSLTRAHDDARGISTPCICGDSWIRPGNRKLSDFRCASLIQALDLPQPPRACRSPA